ncbi:MAG TPA: hypothetical protein VNY05_02065 [Candidatus Acidoferrales bacterium]|nr:hypothetical protein [Candidatus Acidoferrales bacterium]
MDDDKTTARPDWLTVAAIAVVTHALSVSIHEALGHGGTCVAVGCTPRLLTTMQFQGDEHSLPKLAVDAISAGGSVANLVAAAITTLLLRRHRGCARTGWFFLWLFATVNLLAAAGYPLYSGLANIGDWANIVRGLKPAWLWHLCLAAIGALSYWFATRWSMDRLGRRLRGAGSRVPAAYRYTLVSYIAMSAFAIAGGMFEPGGAFLVLISAAAASLGGASALAWGPQLLQDPHLGEPPEEPLQVPRDARWMIAAALVALAFVAVLGPGLSL